MSSEHDAATAQLQGLRAELKKGRQHLHELKEQKERYFSERKALGDRIKQLIGTITGTRTARDTLTTAVKLTKQQREQLHTSIQKKQTELAEARAALDAVLSKSKVKQPIHAIKGEIERLERKIETDVVDFAKEKQIMKVIKELRAQAAEAAKSSKLRDAVRKASDELFELRSQANQTHERVQHTAQESQNKHEAMRDTQKQIDQLRKQEKELTAKIDELKKQMAAIITEIDPKQKTVDELETKLGVEHEARKAEKATRRKQDIQSLKAAVEEKMRKGGKLTTQDILIMQSGDAA